MYVLPHPPATSNHQIEQRANDVFRKLLAIVGLEQVAQNGISFDEYYDKIIYPEHEIELDITQKLGLGDDGSVILGRFLPTENVAQINKGLVETNDPRLVFTLYHEVAGHGVFHGEYLRRTGHKYTDLTTTAATLMKESPQRFESQANIFAAHLAAPRSLIWFLWERDFGMNHAIPYSGPGPYWLTYRRWSEKVVVQSVNHLARYIAKKMKNWFGGLSIEALSYQVEKTVVQPVRSDRRPLVRCGGIRRIGKVVRN